GAFRRDRMAALLNAGYAGGDARPDQTPRRRLRFRLRRRQQPRQPRGAAPRSLPQGDNPVSAFIPVARIADMLLDPGGEFDYDGGQHRYPADLLGGRQSL